MTYDEAMIHLKCLKIVSLKEQPEEYKILYDEALDAIKNELKMMNAPWRVEGISDDETIRIYRGCMRFEQDI